MKKINYLIVFASMMFTNAPLNAQTWYGDAVLSSQAMVDSFAGYIRVTGNMAIVGEATDLAPLSLLKVVEGEFNILYTTLPNLDGLNGLDSVLGCCLYIQHNDSLLNLDGLSGLRYAGESFSVFRNDKLETVNQPTEVTHVPGNLEISGREIKEIKAFDELLSIGAVWSGNLTIQGVQVDTIEGFSQLQSADGLVVHACQKLRNLDFLSSLSQFDNGYFILSNNDSLENVDALYDASGKLPDFCEIKNNPVLANLGGLANFTKAASILIENNASLASLAGLDGLEEAYDIKILNNPVLTELPFNGLKMLRSKLIIRGNAGLQHLSGFNQLDTLAPIGGGEIEIRLNPALQSITGFQQLKSVGGYLPLGILGKIWIWQDSTLQTISGFQQLETVWGNVEIWYNPVLQEMTGFSALKRVYGDLSIVYNPSLDQLSSFENLQRVEGYLSLDAGSLLQITGFENLSYIGDGLSMSGGSNFTSIDGFSNLDTIAGSLFIWGTSSLSDISEFNQLKSIGKAFWIVDNLQLATLDAFNKLKSLGKAIWIERNPVLVNLDGLENVTNFTSNVFFGEDVLKIADNNSLQNIDGLHNLTTIGESDITTWLEIRNNDALTSIQGLSQLKKMHGDSLVIADNDLLSNLDGLENLEKIDGDLRIYNNQSLTDCSALCVVLDHADIGGEIIIENNPMPCGSQEQVEAECLVNKAQEINPNWQVLSISPNPASSECRLLFPGNHEPLTLQLYSPQGRLLRQETAVGESATLQLGAFPAGMYWLCVVKEGELRTREKLIVIR